MTAERPALPLAGTAARPVWSLLDASQRVHLLRVIAVLAGLVVPLLVIGRGAAAILVPVIGGMVAVALHWPRRIEPLQAGLRAPLTLALVAMFVAWLPSVAGSLKPGFSFAIWLQVVGLVVLVPTLAAILAEDAGLYRWTLRVLLTMAVIGGAIAAISLLVWPQLLEYVRPITVTSRAMPINYLKSYGAVMPCLAPLVILAGWKLGGAWRIAAVAALILGALVVHATGNRAALGGYAGAVVLTAAAFMLRGTARGIRVAVAAAAGAVAIAAIGYVVSHLPAMPFQGLDSLRMPAGIVDHHRQAIWGFVLDKALERPWFGWGLSTANFLPGADDPVPGIGQTFVPLHAHNWLLQLFNDAGAIGLLAALAALAAFLLHLDRRWRAGDRGALAALALAGAFFVSTLANFSIWQGWWQSVFCVLLAIALAGGKTRAAGPRP